MIICTGTYIPYEFDNKRDCLQYIEERAHGIRKSLRLVEKDNEHLCLRCPLSGDYIDVVGTSEEILWIDRQLTVRSWYREN